MEYNGKKALVCGMARSGIAAAKLLKKLGAEVTLQDMKKREELSADVRNLENEGIVLYTGANPDDIACEQDIIVLSPGIPCDLPFILAAEEAGVSVPVVRRKASRIHCELISYMENYFIEKL